MKYASPHKDAAGVRDPGTIAAYRPRPSSLVLDSTNKDFEDEDEGRRTRTIKQDVDARIERSLGINYEHL
jgi:hypothetical protein